jgi:hypothetical protein
MFTFLSHALLSELNSPRMRLRGRRAVGRTGAYVFVESQGEGGAEGGGGGGGGKGGGGEGGGGGGGVTVGAALVGDTVVGEAVGETVVGEMLGDTAVGEMLGDTVVGETVGDTVVGEVVGLAVRQSVPRSEPLVLYVRPLLRGTTGPHSPTLLWNCLHSPHAAAVSASESIP